MYWTLFVGNTILVSHTVSAIVWVQFFVLLFILWCNCQYLLGVSLVLLHVFLFILIYSALWGLLLLHGKSDTGFCVISLHGSLSSSE